MPLLVVGSIAIDSIESPHGSAPEILGGSATHFSLTASLFTRVKLVGVIGEDFPEDYLSVLRGRDLCLDGLQVLPGRSFRWSGRYEGTMAQAETLSVELNLFGSFEPTLPEHYRDTPFVFLANGSPHVQRKVLDHVRDEPFVLMDTMNLWIETERRALTELLGQVDALVINDEEIRELTRESNLIVAGRQVLGMGPRTVVIKKGEHGALLLQGDQVFAAPAFPLTEVRDPTGAGDTFAGGLMGTLARIGHKRPSFDDLKLATCVGIVCSSFNVEDFGPNRIRGLAPQQMMERYERYMQMLNVSGAPLLNASLAGQGAA
jgi:sugar/nucleoside kinase (ribokinase family)